MIKAADNFVVLKRPEKILFDSSGAAFFDIDEDRNDFRDFAEVVSAPDFLFYYSPEKTFYSEHDKELHEFSLEFDSDMEIKDGDIVMFKHSAFFGEQIVDGYFIVKYDELIAVVREGKLFPINGYVLVYPDDYKAKDVVKKIGFDYTLNSGVVVSQGVPVRGYKGQNDVVCSNEDFVWKRVYFNKLTAFRIEYDGRNLFGGDRPLYAIQQKWIRLVEYEV
jgi:hypothetical protein